MAKSLHTPLFRPPGHRAAPSRRGSGRLGEAYAELLAAADIRVGGDRPWDMQVHDARLWRRLLLGGTVGLGEAYVDGWWDAARVDAFVAHAVAAHLDERIPDLPKRLAALGAAWRNLQDRVRARRVAEIHYDLDHEMYRAMLGESMVYTCGYWAGADDLEQAQADKLELVCRKLDLRPGMRVLDIGCGWGGFARHAAAHHGVEVVGVTISRSQADIARRACAGLPVTIELEDYREVRGRFDRIVSLGMFEHVGRKNYRRFATLLRQCLADDGLALLHTIGRNDDGAGIDPWVTRYIFPNSEIPTIARLAHAFSGLLVMEDWHNFGADYDRTLMAWHRNFAAAWPRFAARFDRRFRRTWTYYLLSFAGVFRARGLQLWQVVLSPHGVPGGYRRPAG
ncbi:MAG: cyclopropane fatty acyl phospholipid synthase [Gammaproteobacteria bacterium]|nr:cyclopropane fatty acyl phospholipid synthase [Gammaproteobacteria bacterium]MCP5200056.1 cyclopropane fatty acyl phospholipid synthase [Gammaproteobacteria bacterium]